MLTKPFNAESEKKYTSLPASERADWKIEVERPRAQFNVNFTSFKRLAVICVGYVFSLQIERNIFLFDWKELNFNENYLIKCIEFIWISSLKFYKVVFYIRINKCFNNRFVWIKQAPFYRCSKNWLEIQMTSHLSLLGETEVKWTFACTEPAVLNSMGRE